MPNDIHLASVEVVARGMEDNNKEDEKMVVEINKILEEVRPSLQSHGGDARLREVREGKVYLDLQGACSNCPMSVMTFGVVVDEMIKEKLPQIKEVIFE